MGNRRYILPIAANASVPQLSEVAVTLSGVQFDPQSDVWDYFDGIDRVVIDFGRYGARLSSNLINTVKAVLVHAILEVAPRTIIGWAYSLDRFVMAMPEVEYPIDVIKSSHINSFEKLGLHIGHLKDLRQIFLRWNGLLYPGIEKNAVTYLQRKKFPPVVRGESVLTWCPIRGPLTDLEFKSTYDGLLEAFAVGRLSRQLFLIAWLSASLGLRPRQLALLKVCDVVEQHNGGDVEYRLHIPRIKQHGQTPRDEMYEWGVINEIGEILCQQAQESRHYFANFLESLDDAPLFFSAALLATEIETLAGEESGPDDVFDDDEHPIGREWGEGYKFHVQSPMMSQWLVAAFKKVDKRSERVGENMHVTATRLRKTFGTRLAASGTPPPVISTLMGHRDIKSGQNYFAATSGLQRRLDEAMTFELAPIAQAFSGELLSNWEDERGTAVIRDLRIVPSGDPLGKCGKHGFCGLAAPIACYTCKKYRPWKDGPHRAVFDYLWHKREKRVKAREETNLDMVLLHDRTILAVAHVILLCEQESVV